jgi:hypothetical protein
MSNRFSAGEVLTLEEEISRMESHGRGKKGALGEPGTSEKK